MTTQFTLAIDTDNAAFDEGGGAEIARILREVAERIERGDVSGSARDINGNTVCHFEWDTTEPLGPTENIGSTTWRKPRTKIGDIDQ